MLGHVGCSVEQTLLFQIAGMGWHLCSQWRLPTVCSLLQDLENSSVSFSLPRTAVNLTFPVSIWARRVQSHAWYMS